MLIDPNEKHSRMLMLRCRPSEIKAWTQRANVEGRTLSSWIRHVLNEHAMKQQYEIRKTIDMLTKLGL